MTTSPPSTAGPHTENLVAYLRDHYAGSVGAVELVEHLIVLNRGTERGSFLEGLRDQIEADQDVLKRLLQGMESGPNVTRDAAAWIAEKFAWLKFRLAHAGGNRLGLLEAFESVELGIEGKLALWRALAAVPGIIPAVSTINLALLQERAKQQLESVESHRLSIARETFLP